MTKVLNSAIANAEDTQNVDVEFDGGPTAGAVTDSIAARMALPDDVAWALRDDRGGAYLDDGAPIGGQIDPGARVTITPRAHLGGRPGGL